MFNKALLKDLEKQLPKPVYFIWSEDKLFLEGLLERASEVVVSQLRDFNYNIFYPSAEPSDILDTAFTLPMMSQRRLVVIKDFHQFPASAVKTITTYLGKPCETTCMLILSQKEPKKEFANLPVFLLKVKDQDIPLWIKQKAQEKGMKITDEAQDYLIEFVGNDVGMLSAEIEKLAASGLKAITPKDIMASTGMVREFTAFNLLDAVIGGRKAKAFGILKTIMEGRSSDMAVSIIGALNWHYRQFYSLWYSKGKRPQKMREATYRALFKYLSFYREEDFYQIFRNLHEADICMKSGGMPEFTLEVLLLKLLKQGAKN
ncbi:MAG: DNA polymerase III subunit delta [Nitrospirae bacterium]|nr:DNA polymerase III subunit delta [Nitrospirota bacterium]